MTTPLTDERPLRADAERNRRRIIEAARTVFAERGFSASVDEIARAAGVGMGTLYRRFPTKRDLALAVAEDRAETVIAAIEDAADETDVDVALHNGLLAFVAGKAQDRAFYDAVRDEIVGEPELERVRERLLDGLRPLVARAQGEGALREDVAAEDLLPLLASLGHLPPSLTEANPELWRRYFAIVLDGLRPEGARKLPCAPPNYPCGPPSA